MSVYELFKCGEASVEQLVQDAKEKVRWSAEPIVPGESIGAQIRKASNELRLDYGITRRAWYGICGPETYVIIFNHWQALVQRRAEQLVQQQRATWIVVSNSEIKSTESRAAHQPLLRRARAGA